MTNERKNNFTLMELVVTTALIGIVAAAGTGIYLGTRAINKYIDSPRGQVERANVIGDSRAEKFIEYKGDRFYSEIDGKRVEQYFTTNTVTEAKK